MDLSTAAAAVLVASGNIYEGVNLESRQGPCAEPVALGAASAQGERRIVGCVAVDRRGKILPPCGNCRQTLHRHAPGARLLLGSASRPRLVRVAALLPSPYLEHPRRL